MPWNESWRTANRPPASEHPKKYGFWPGGRSSMIFSYFIAITVADYLALTFLGTRPVIIAGIPLLIWITIVFAALTIGGILGFSSTKNSD